MRETTDRETVGDGGADAEADAAQVGAPAAIEGIAGPVGGAAPGGADAPGPGEASAIGLVQVSRAGEMPPCPGSNANGEPGPPGEALPFAIASWRAGAQPASAVAQPGRPRAARASADDRAPAASLAISVSGGATRRRTEIAGLAPLSIGRRPPTSGLRAGAGSVARWSRARAGEGLDGMMSAGGAGGTGSGGTLGRSVARATAARAPAAAATPPGADGFAAADPGAVIDPGCGDGTADDASDDDAAADGANDGGAAEEAGRAKRDTVGVNGAPTRIRRTGRSAGGTDGTAAAPTAPAAVCVDISFDRPSSLASDRATSGAAEPVDAVAGCEGA